MSTIDVSNLNDGTTTVATTFITNGPAKARVQYDQSSAAISDSFNMSSVTDSSTGNFRTNFTSSMSNSNYCSVGMVRTYHINSSSSDDKTVTGELHQTFYVSNTSGGRTSHDVGRCSVSYHGDLA